jgi:O-methyltransferase involved in polyketide biosynthesis
MKDGDISVTALYTSQTWVFAGVPNAALFAHKDAKSVFDATNLVLGLVRLFRPSLPVLRCSLAQRHAMIDLVVRESGATQVLEIASGLSPRGATFSRDPAVRYVEVDLPGMVARKRELLLRTEEGKAVLARPNWTLEGADARTDDLAARLEAGRPACVVGEGLFMYLDAAEQRGLWSRIATALRAAGSGTFVFDLTPGPEQPRPGILGRALRWLMERFTKGKSFEKDGRVRGDYLRELSEAGFDGVESLEAGPLLESWKLPFPGERTQVVLFRCRVGGPG